MEYKLFIIFILFSWALYAQTNDIVLAKQFQNVEFKKTTSRQIKHKLRGKKLVKETSSSYVTTFDKCYHVKHLTLTYPNNGLTFIFRKGMPHKKYILTKIILDSLATGYINYSLKVNQSVTNDVIDKYGTPKINENGKLIYGSNSIIFYYDKKSVIRRIEINSNKINNEN